MKCNGTFSEKSFGNRMEYVCNHCGHKFTGSVLFFGAITCPKCGKNIHPIDKDVKIDMR